MRDVELIVRFLALYECTQSYSKPMKKFLNDFMEAHKKGIDSGKYRNMFVETAANVVGALGERPFHIRRGINVAACDSVMVAFSKHKTPPGNVLERYKELLDNNKYNAAITAGTTDVDTVKERLSLAQEILFS